MVVQKFITTWAHPIYGGSKIYYNLGVYSGLPNNFARAARSSGSQLFPTLLVFKNFSNCFSLNAAILGFDPVDNRSTIPCLRISSEFAWRASGCMFWYILNAPTPSG